MNNYPDFDLDSDNSLSHGRANADSYYISHDFNSAFDNLSHKDLGIIHINIRSLARNGDKLVSYLNTLRYKFPVICCSETWLNSIRFIDNMFPDYNQYHSMRPVNKPYGGGTSIFIHKNVQSEHLLDISCNDENIECVFASVKHGNNNLVIGCCYRQPNSSNADYFTTSLVDKISNIDANAHKILVGDFNFNLLNLENDHDCASFLDALLSVGLINTISKPTRPQSMTLLDNIFISHYLDFDSGLFKWDITDHYPVFTICQNFFDINSNKSTIKYRLINDISLDSFYESLQTCNFERVLNNNDLDEAFANLDTILHDHLNQFCPIVTKTITKKDRMKPWVNSHLKSLTFYTSTKVS